MSPEEMEFQPFIAPLTELLDIYRHEQKARKNQEKKDKTADCEEQEELGGGETDMHRGWALF
uniref:Uncharacterized protein n=1 Tax=Terrapene triunguis TaxID=2587831 RepID=A0A674K1F7_9SAUR